MAVASTHPAPPNAHAPPPLPPAKPGASIGGAPLRCYRAQMCALRRPLTLALCVRTGVARTAAGASTQVSLAGLPEWRAGTEEND